MVLICSFNFCVFFFFSTVSQFSNVTRKNFCFMYLEQFVQVIVKKLKSHSVILNITWLFIFYIQIQNILDSNEEYPVKYKIQPSIISVWNIIMFLKPRSYLLFHSTNFRKNNKLFSNDVMFPWNHFNFKLKIKRN